MTRPKSTTKTPAGASWPHPTILRRLALPKLPPGRGRAAAPLVWLALASHARWTATGPDLDVWPSNERLASETGLQVRTVELALAILRASGKISSRYGARPGRYHRGRTITLHLIGDGPAPRVLLPGRERMAEIWRRARGSRERPASTVALAVACYACAAAAARGPLDDDAETRATLATLRVLTGASHGGTFSGRLESLAAAGILRRSGERWRDGVTVVAVEAPAEPVVLPVAPLRSVTVEQMDELLVAGVWEPVGPEFDILYGRHVHGFEVAS